MWPKCRIKKLPLFSFPAQPITKPYLLKPKGCGISHYAIKLALAFTSFLKHWKLVWFYFFSNISISIHFILEDFLELASPRKISCKDHKKVMYVYVSFNVNIIMNHFRLYFFIHFHFHLRNEPENKKHLSSMCVKWHVNKPDSFSSQQVMELLNMFFKRC